MDMTPKAWACMAIAAILVFAFLACIAVSTFMGLQCLINLLWSSK
jgi:hypothetical protein